MTEHFLKLPIHSTIEMPFNIPHLVAMYRDEEKVEWDIIIRYQDNCFFSLNRSICVDIEEKHVGRTAHRLPTNLNELLGII